MKKLICFCFLLISYSLAAQEKIETTDQFSIEGKVKKPSAFSMEDLSSFEIHTIDSLVIYNHLMQPGKTIKNIKGVLLKDLLDRVGLVTNSPKLLSELYITCVASDNYKVVFSWNELFNSAVGEKVMLITESNGQSGNKMDDRIALISASDRATGRRYVKGLQKIVIEQVK